MRRFARGSSAMSSVPSRVRGDGRAVCRLRNGHHARLWLPPVLLGGAAIALALSGQNTALFLAINGGPMSAPAFWSVLSILGHGSVLFAVWIWLLALQPRLIAALLLLVPIAGLVIRVSKWLAESPRPAAVLSPEQIEIVGQVLRAYSLPSGHAITVFGLAAVLVVGAPRSWAWQAIAWTSVLLACLVSLSRIAVGAHWPLDVLVGGALGWLCGVLAVDCTGRVRLWRKVWVRRRMALIVLVAAALLYRTPLGYPLAEPAKFLFATFGLLVASWIARSPRAAARQVRGWLNRPAAA